MSNLTVEMDRLFDLYFQDGNTAHLEAIFRLIDTDNSGEITKQEAIDMFRPLAHSNAEFVANRFVTDADKNGDEKISLAEFLAHFAQ